MLGLVVLLTLAIPFFSLRMGFSDAGNGPTDQTTRRAYDMQEEVAITVATPEDAPLAVFGGAVSEAVDALLEESGILIITSAHCETPRPGEVALHPGGRSLYGDRIIAHYLRAARRRCASE